MSTQKEVTVIWEGGDRIDPTLVPDADIHEMFRIIKPIIRKALANPKTRAEFEAWRKKYAAQQAANHKDMEESEHET